MFTTVDGKTVKYSVVGPDFDYDGIYFMFTVAPGGAAKNMNIDFLTGTVEFTVNRWVSSNLSEIIGGIPRLSLLDTHYWVEPTQSGNWKEIDTLDLKRSLIECVNQIT